MATAKQKEEVREYWNSKGIIVHRRMTHDLDTEIGRSLGHYSVEELEVLIDFYATILEAGTPEGEKKYFWSHKWNLWEFLRRGVKQFDGKEVSDYLRKKKVEAPEAVVFSRGKK